MSRENAEDKGRRYLTEARLEVTGRHGDHVLARCRGDGEVYRLGHTVGIGWWCRCPARTDRCAHLVALRLVTSRQAPDPRRNPT
jgi:uncharacterized Zn finger protein